MGKGNYRNPLLLLATGLSLVSSVGYLWVAANIKANIDWVTNPENHARWFAVAWLVAELIRLVVPLLVTVLVFAKAPRSLIGSGFAVSALAGLPFVFAISFVESLLTGEAFDSLDAFWFSNPDLGLNLMQIGDYVAIAAAILGIVGLSRDRLPERPLEIETIQVDDGR